MSNSTPRLTSRSRYVVLIAVAFLAVVVLAQQIYFSSHVRAANSFSAGNVVVYRVGDGSTGLTGVAAPVFLDEYTPAGTLVQTIAMPTSVSGSNKRLVASGSATTEGLMARSADGKYLVVSGYDAATGATVTTATSATVNRVVGLVDSGANIDTTTALSDAFNTGNIRSAVSSDGTRIWMSGNVEGVRTTTRGATTSSLVSITQPNLRAINIFNGQLYVSSGSGTNTTRGVNKVGTGLPTSSGNATTRLAGLTDTADPSTYGFVILDNPNNAISGIDTIYVADDTTGGTEGGLQKWTSTDGINWTKQYRAILGSAAFRGVAGKYNGTTLSLFAVTTDSKLVAVTDTGSGFTFTTLATAGTNTALRGVALAPVDPNAPTNPTGVGAANPNPVLAGNSTLLTVTVTPGTNIASTGLAVTGDLSLIGGSATQQFFDDGTHGDAAAGDHVFSFQATVPSNTTGVPKSLTTTISDAQARHSNATISLNVLAPTPPTGVGAATPSTVQAGNQTKLTVTVTAGANPTSSGLGVSGDLTSIGGSASQQFFDDGSHGDVTSGDNIFTFQATVSAGTATGAKSLLTTINDSQSRTGNASISLTVTAASTPPTGVGSATPSSLQTANSTLLKVNVTPGANPVSSGIGVTGDLSSIGGSASQQFFDDGTHGDATAADSIFSFQATVSASPGGKTIPITVSDGQARSSSTSISLTVLTPPPPTTIKVSQVYGGGGNSGATYTNDFIEIYNQGPTTIDVSSWSVQYQSATATGAWQVTNMCPAAQTCTVAPGHYYLVQESQGGGGTTLLPTADATGVIPMGATAGKVALVNNSTALVTPALGGCPAPGSIADLVGYGGANCSETAPTAALGNTIAAVRRGNGCIDTDNNASDFVTIGPIPRNSASPVNSCGGDPTQISGLGLASPSTLDPASNTLLSVVVTPATTPASTGISVNANLTNIGGPASQQFYDDGTHGDATAGDNTFSYLATIPVALTTGAKSVVATITDGQARTATAPITLTIQSPTCGVERWSVKVGTDADVNLVDLNNPVQGFIHDLGLIPAPVDPPGPPLNNRVAPTETTVYVVNATMTFYKKETDVDYHIVLQDDNGNTMIAEIPNPACVISTNTPRVLLPSPLAAGIANARAKFDARFNATTSFTPTSVPVQITGVGFFDFIHGQTGVAPNGIELHPVLDISFTNNSTTTLTSSINPSQYHQSVDFVATVTNGGVSTPTGTVNFFDNAILLGSGTLNGSGQATFSTNTLAVGSHPITAHYEGDSMSATSGTTVVTTQVVNKADQTINFGPLSGKTFGDPDFTISATSTSSLPVSFSILSGPATISGNTVHITGAGTVMIEASQAGNANYNAAPDATQSFEVAKAGQVITFAALGNKTYGNAPFSVSATGGGSGNPVTFGASGNCTAGGTNGSTITITGAGSCTVTASEAGNSNYDAALDVSRSFTINQATANITVNDYNGVYDGNAHGVTGSATGVNGEDLSGLLTLGATFTDVPGGTAHWSFAGNANYATASGDATVNITQATATINVTGYSGVYDGQAHGATGSATGLNSLDLSSLLDFGLSFTSVPGGTAHWTFAGNTNYAPAAGDVTIAISQASATINVNGYTGVYDGGAHGATGSATGVSNEPLSSLLNLGASFTNVPGGTAHWTFAGNTNYAPASGDVAITISQATATINVTGYTGVYDVGAHGASGSATGVNNEPLTSLLNLGASFTNVPGGTAHWTFAGDTNYAPASGDVAITISKATPTITWSNPADIIYGTALSSTQLNATANVGGSFNYSPASGTILSANPGQALLASFTPTDTTNYNSTSKNVMINVLKATPSFSNLSSPTITSGTATTNLAGKISFGSFIPTGNVAITLNGVTQNAAIQAGGNFSSSFATGSLAAGSYNIAYSYGGDVNFNSASGSGTLQVGYNIVVLYDQTKVRQSGSTIPIKLQITGANGNNLSSAGTVVTAVGISLISTSVYGPVEDAGNSNPDSNFRFVSDSYIFNLQTTGLATGTYNLYFRVGADPTLHTVQFQIK